MLCPDESPIRPLSPPCAFMPYGWCWRVAPDSGPALGAGVLSFIIGYILYLFRIIGAGDVKLFAAVALFAGHTHLPHLALATAISGGLVAAVNILVRPYLSQAMLVLQGKDMGRDVPYGVAIAIGGIGILWAAITGLLPADLLINAGR